MVRLRDRNKQIPYGLKFTEQHTGWKSPSYASFDTIVRGIIANRMGNPAQTAQRHLSTDYDQVAREVDYYNALACQQMSWGDYIVNDAGLAPPSLPKTMPPISRLRAVAGAANVLVDFVTKDEAVPQALSESRAAVCTSMLRDAEGNVKPCPFNEKGDWLSWFTVPVSEAIRKTMQLKTNMGLSTSKDPELHVCSACLCPLKLLVHFPIEKKLKSLTLESKAALHPNCWVLSEEKALTTQPA